MGLDQDRCYDSYKKMAFLESKREDGIQALGIMTPSGDHLKIAKPFIEKGIHIVCDKPLTSNISDAEKLKKLVHKNNKVFHVSLLEKLFILLIPKITFLIPDGGIWLNTQRPEWNDANNALVGYGVSMVTLYYLNRHILFINKVLSDVNSVEVEISSEVVLWFKAIRGIFENYSSYIDSKIEPIYRKNFVVELQEAFSNYRSKTYNKISKTSGKLKVVDLLSFNNLVLKHFGSSIKNNLNNSLYNAYNTINIDKTNEINVSSLFPMLEGQVCLLYTSPSPRDLSTSRMPSSA